MNLRPFWLVVTIWCAWCVIWASLYRSPILALLNAFCAYRAFWFWRRA